MSNPNHNRAKEAWLKAVGRNVRERRKAVNLTQERLAELADLAPRTIQKIEAGKIDILISTLRRVRAAIGCRFDELLVL